MVERLEQARITDKADETGAVKFNIIDPPVAKLEPVAPKRGAWVLVGMLFGLVAGCGAAYCMPASQSVTGKPCRTPPCQPSGPGRQ
jgi:uncharacterized protein involved in exopolysaccharide biosynthesis